uniref:Regulator of G protein signaling 21 n=1 Tax=Strigops habroptila TaxID=2489341 RepID=A0A672V1T3_STRHB
MQSAVLKGRGGMFLQAANTIYLWSLLKGHLRRQKSSERTNCWLICQTMSDTKVTLYIMHIYIHTHVYIHTYDLHWSFSFLLPIISCIFSPDGLAAFRTFLKSEFSEENVEFWLACEDFKKTKSSAKIASKAQKIYSDFIQPDAPKEINIDFQTKTHISQNISEPTLSCFDDAQRLVYSLMAKDSFPRFLRSEVYKELVKNIFYNNSKQEK